MAQPDHQNLVPIRIKITRGMRNGRMQNIYPNFNKIASNIRQGLDWSNYFDQFGLSWHYDRKSGFGDTDTYNSDPNVQYGCTCVPQDFADKAVEQFPGSVEQIKEVDFEKFYNEQAHAHEPEENYSTEVLQALSAKKDLGLALSAHDNRCLDPDDPCPGIVKNKNKTWKLHKSRRKCTIHPDLADDSSSSSSST